MLDMKWVRDHYDEVAEMLASRNNAFPLDRYKELDEERRSVIAEADYVVRIPMAHGVDSLNVAAASAVAFWELRTPSPAPTDGEDSGADGQVPPT